MNGNVHVRFCSRAGMATFRLRQRPQLGRWVRRNPVEGEGLGILADVHRALRPTNSSQAAAVCGESRTYGHNGGDGKTPFGCASCPYPLTSNPRSP